MKISDLPTPQLASLLQRGELLLRLGPFVARIQSDAPSLASDIGLVYRDFHTVPSDRFADFHVAVKRETGLRRWVKPLVRFYFDGRASFIPLPVAQAFPMLEWGLNWCVAAHCHQFMIIHAAVIEKDGRAAVLPAPPGSGKSTLCTGLVLRGWRLLSDELALYDMDSGLIHGMARPINLKNRSIDVIKAFEPAAVMTAPVPNTTKGTVALLRPPADSVLRAAEPVRPAWVVLPRYQADAEPELLPHGKARTAMLMAEQSFNYAVQGERGFAALCRLVDECHCHQFTYSRLNDAERVFNELVAGVA